MQSAATIRSWSSPDSEVIPVFRVVIVYEDFRTGRQAGQAYDFLVENLSHEWQVTSQRWKFEGLSVPELRELAAQDAGMADLIIISSRGGELPAEVKDWMEMWLGYRSGVVALVALFDCPPGRTGNARVTQAYLEGVAKRGQMEFFTWPEVRAEKASPRERVILDCRWEMAGEALIPVMAAAPREEGVFPWCFDE